MVLDSEQQRKLLLEILDAVTVKGSHVEAVYLLRKAITEAKVIELEACTA